MWQFAANMGKKTKKQRQDSKKKAKKQQKNNSPASDSINAIFKVSICYLTNQTSAALFHSPCPPQPVLKAQKNRAAVSQATAASPLRRRCVRLLHTPCSALPLQGSNRCLLLVAPCCSLIFVEQPPSCCLISSCVMPACTRPGGAIKRGGWRRCK